MANADTNMNTYFDPLPHADIHYSDMAGALVNLSFSDMEADERLLLAHCCDESRAGLCHCLDFLGDMLVTFSQQGVNEFTPESLCQLGHTLTTFGRLIPALTDMSQFIHADRRQLEELAA
ncbi:hypothetical protein KGG53_05375 [Klebsiella pneumoniae]|uniref:hypothetical protein n=1 Tax=Klebsiella pneumoniae TaxID=573 RepID=UPI001D0A57B6|nr:hypothetical protein [Klebsiella pneumoniae]MCB8425730.1 hypothetical protein [Klebsiella pneumoniae]MCB8460867.1 hypothetical protein [Klebsiella pneumoniae]HDH0544274.1 hypothetical protein [Klebsiella pneumoniae]